MGEIFFSIFVCYWIFGIVLQIVEFYVMCLSFGVLAHINIIHSKILDGVYSYFISAVK